MVGCAAMGCHNRTSEKKSGYEQPPGITFHRFPRNEQLRLKWILGIGKRNWVPTKWSNVCSAHFKESDLDRTSLSCTRVRADAVPSIFSVTENETQKEKKQLEKCTKEVEFKPEMWEDKSESSEETVGTLKISIDEQPSKHSITDESITITDESVTDENVNVNGNNTSTISSSGTFWPEKFGDKDYGESFTKRPRGRPRKTPNSDENRSEINGDKSEDSEEPVIKRPRGRPRKQPISDEKRSEESGEPAIKRPRGRPRKNPSSDENVDNNGKSSILGSSGIFSESVGCCALACPNTSDTNVMNRLPEESSLRQLWIQKIDRLAWIPDVDSALCDIHFDSDMWDSNKGGEKSLKHDAIPTLFLHGEAIKSWVTLDNTGKMEKLTVVDLESDAEDGENNSEKDDDEEEQDNDEDMADDIFVKREALEPEINMVEGSEEVMPQNTSLVSEQFETIFCDTNFIDQLQNPKRTKQDSVNEGVSTDQLENPLSPETIYIDENSGSNLSNMTNEDSDFRVNISEVKSLAGEAEGKPFFEILSPASQEIIDGKKGRRRNSSQLSNKYECPICERRLSRRKNLEIHISKLHPNGELSARQKRNKMIQEHEESNKQNEKINGQDEIPKKKDNNPKKQDVIPTNREEKPKSVNELHSSFCLFAPPPTPPPPHVVQPLLEMPPMVTPPRLLDPSPAGGEVKKQFVLLVPNALPEQLPPIPPVKDNLVFPINMAKVPPEKRLPLRIKLRELVDAVINKNLNPERIIIAYDGT